VEFTVQQKISQKTAKTYLITSIDPEVFSCNIP